MKNKTKIYIIIVFLSLIVIVGIKNINDKKSLNQSITEQNELEQNKHKENKYEWKSDISIDDIIDVDYYFRGFITKSGDLYLYSQNKLFSNEKHYKKVDTEIKFIRFIDTAGVLSNDGKLYYLKNDKLIENNDKKFKETFEKIDYKKVFKITNNVYGYYDENSIYYIKYNILNFTYEDPVLIGSIPKDEKIININSNLSRVYIKTDKNYYLIEEVQKYQDQNLIYEITKKEEESNNYDNISFCNEELLIYKDDLNNFYTRESHNWDI